MHTYAIAHIGSCTAALSIFEKEGHEIHEIYHERAPLCLSTYLGNDHMIEREGIHLASTTLLDFGKICDEKHVGTRWCYITSPARTDNGQTLVNVLRHSDFGIFPLRGQEEAVCDFLGTRLSFPDITNGIAFDIGGGSTRLISFHFSKPLDAAMFRLGSMSRRKDVLEKYRERLDETRETYDTLHTPCSTMIGAGDTVNDIARVCTAFWPNEQMKHMREVEDVRKRITDGDPAVLQAIRELVPSERQANFLTGYDMFLIIAKTYEAERIMISPTGITEGFLLSRLEDMK